MKQDNKHIFSNMNFKTHTLTEVNYLHSYLMRGFNK